MRYNRRYFSVILTVYGKKFAHSENSSYLCTEQFGDLLKTSAGLSILSVEVFLCQYIAIL